MTYSERDGIVLNSLQYSLHLDKKVKTSNNFSHIATFIKNLNTPIHSFFLKNKEDLLMGVPSNDTFKLLKSYSESSKIIVD